jgi:hypothetical protein
VAYDNIYAFHAAQKLPEKTVENMKVREGEMLSSLHLHYSPYLYA